MKQSRNRKKRSNCITMYSHVHICSTFMFTHIYNVNKHEISHNFHLNTRRILNPSSSPTPLKKIMHEWKDPAIKEKLRYDGYLINAVWSLL